MAPAKKAQNTGTITTSTAVVVDEPAVEKTPGELAVEAAEAAAIRASLLKEAVPERLLVKQYRVMVDGIVAGDEQQALGISVLKDLVTRADIENAGADFAWLLKTGAIEEAGYGN